MPRMDGTGPDGIGPTGRKLGPCGAGSANTTGTGASRTNWIGWLWGILGAWGTGTRRGGGRGMGGGRGQGQGGRGRL